MSDKNSKIRFIRICRFTLLLLITIGIIIGLGWFPWRSYRHLAKVE